MFTLERGHFYAVGVGPGSGDLLTLRAVKVISRADLIICPASTKTKSSFALDIISPWVSTQQIEVIRYPMQRDSQSTWQCWAKVAKKVAAWCAKDKIVCQITLGDPLFYSTSCYLLPQVIELIGQTKVHVVPGITAFQTAGANLGLPLVWQEDAFLLLPATDLERIAWALEHCETLVLYKVGQRLPEVLQLLEQKKLLEKTYLAAYLEQANEYLLQKLDPNVKVPGYLVTLIVKIKHKSW
ncbi:MAG: precorrin-2 C(20)-methyltransferase [Desulfonauticus sp.]|nr:precorrin-2 C(20)-methyltransferase [Desulfonauticus sp.]